MKKKNNKRALMGIIGATLAFGGMMPTTSASNDKADLATNTRYADVNQLSRTVVQHVARTPLGTPINQGGRQWYKPVPQKHKKHTNRLKSSHSAKVKRRKARNSR